MERFQQECAFLESIRHPNIVQYLGMTRDPESRLPVLLMELLDENLTKMLERSQQSLAYYVQVDICHDIALAVAYLHSNDIIHRDLSSNNVLMITGRRAKVTDFGMSKLAGAAPSMTSLTMCPGTHVYMPPEALRESPRYTKKLDCFSEGVIIIQVYTRLWPEPGPRNKLVPDSRSPTGMMDMPVLETERRKNHIDLINSAHKLLPIAVDCLSYQDNERPSSEVLCQRLAGLKESREYKDDLQKQFDEIQAKDNQLIHLTEQLQEKDRILYQQEQERNRVLQEKESQLREERASRDRQLQQLNQKLREYEQIIADIQQTDQSLQRQVEQLQQQLSQQSLKLPQPPPPSQAQVRGRQHQERESPLQTDHKPHPYRKMTLNWRDGGKAPLKIERGAAVVDGNMAYFMNCNGEVYSYNASTSTWSMCLKCPYEYGSLAVIDGQLVAIGGCRDWCNKDTYTNKLLSLYETWREVFPPMPTKRQSATAVTLKEHLIVAGGKIGAPLYHCISTVEVMDIEILVWSTVASLLHPYTGASGTICGDRIFMLGGFDDKYMTKSVLTCSLTELLQASSSSSSVWHRVTDTPACRSTCVAVNGELLAVGGCDKDYKPTAAIHKYNPTTNSWDLISNMPTARYRSLVAVLPTNEIKVIGGRDQDTVEIASIIYTETSSVTVSM